jgi:16S rRNA A1518/A1519 N6-dimethyltransferase RsmA/KsgA/DIM1 with predicted DNA glycosylase/AP lyase activity
VTYEYYEPSAGGEDEPFFEHFVNFLFAGRRKKVANRLVTLLGGAMAAAEVATKMREAGFDPEARPERLSPEEFAGLYRAFRPHVLPST